MSKNTFATSGDTLTVNPVLFDSTTVINFTIGANDTIWLDIFDVLGRSVKTYYSATVLPSGSYSLNYNGDTLKSGIYYVRLKINSNILAKKIMKTNSLASVREHITQQANILLFPNPTTETLKILIDGVKTVIVRDVSGREVMNYVTPSNSISLVMLENGVYFVTLLSQDKQILATQKIVKIAAAL